MGPLAMRSPVVAGSFYSGTASALEAQVRSCFRHPLGPGDPGAPPSEPAPAILGLVSPHAGYAYSGHVAAFGYYHLARQRLPEVVVLLGPNHTGSGAAVAVSREDQWRTPLGDLEVDAAVAEKIISSTPVARFDDAAHRREHSIEVQLPFLQYVSKGTAVRIVPIAMLRQDQATSRALGTAIAAAIDGKNAVVIASSDFTHYEPARHAAAKDEMVLDAIIGLDANGVGERVARHNITMCGPGPVMAMLVATRLMGATSASLLKYGNSGDITGDDAQVVGYASLKITR